MAWISELSNTKEEPKFVTKNGYGDLVILSIKTYERQMASVDLYRKLAEAEEQIINGEQLLDAEDVFMKMRKKYGV